MMSVDFGYELYAALIVTAVLTIVSFFAAIYRPAMRRILGYVVMALGVLLMLALGRYQIRLALFGVRAEGIVLAVEPHRKSVRPVVRFVSASEQEVVFHGADISDRTYYTPGQRVPIRYLRSNPAFAEVDSWLSLWRPLLIGALFDGSVFVGGAFIVYRHRRVRAPT